jgi:hypothetical protein
MVSCFQEFGTKLCTALALGCLTKKDDAADLNVDYQTAITSKRSGKPMKIGLKLVSWTSESQSTGP